MTNPLDNDDRRLADLLGGSAPTPRKSEDAFARTVASELRARRQQPGAALTWLWSGAASAAALALFVTLSSPGGGAGGAAGVEVSALTDEARAALFEEQEEIVSLESFEEDPSAAALDELEDEELLALSAALEEALSL